MASTFYAYVVFICYFRFYIAMFSCCICKGLIAVYFWYVFCKLNDKSYFCLYFILFFTNPGIVKNRILWAEKKENEGQNDNEVLEQEIKICSICKVSVNTSDHAEHCERCGICILGYYDHCRWISKCIGKYNQHFYKYFLGSAGLLVLSFIFDLEVRDMLRKSGKEVIVVLNKIDQAKNPGKKETLSTVKGKEDYKRRTNKNFY